MRAAFFDLDRTLVRVNTGTRYVGWRFSAGQMGLREVLRTGVWTLQYTLGVLDADRVGRQVAATLTGRDEASFRDEVAAWARREVLPEITDAARAEVDARRGAGDVVALLTSGSPYVADVVAESVGVEHVLSSRFEIEDGRFTGRVSGPLCYGVGKVTAAEAWATARGVALEDCLFYTDSVSDLPMLERVGGPRVVNPDPRLRRVARRRGWRVLSW